MLSTIQSTQYNSKFSPKISIEIMQYYTMHQLHLNYRCVKYSPSLMQWMTQTTIDMKFFQTYINQQISFNFLLVNHSQSTLNIFFAIYPTMHFKKTSHTSIQHLIFQNYNGCSTNHQWSNNACLKKAPTQLSKVDFNFG